MLIHHSNIEIDSNDSLFFLRKTRESKTRNVRRSELLSFLPGKVSDLCSSIEAPFTDILNVDNILWVTEKLDHKTFSVYLMTSSLLGMYLELDKQGGEEHSLCL